MELPAPYDWTKADRYARNFVLNALENHAREMDMLASGVMPDRFRVAYERRAYAYHAAMVLLSREGGG